MSKRIIGLTLAALLVLPAYAAKAPDDGLVARHSRDLDHVRVASAPASYRSVYIPPIEVEFQPMRDANAMPEVTRRNTPADRKRLSQEMAQALRATFQGELQRAGYAIASAPGAGVLVLRVSLEDVYVNAPDNATFARTNTFVNEAGEARLHVEGFDGGSQSKVLAIDDRARARAHMGGFDRANNVTNRFWFQEMFDRWAAGVAYELSARNAG